MDFSFIKSSKLVLENGAIPLTWWANTPNFGDLLSPYLVKKLTSLPVSLVGPNASGIKRLNPFVQDKFSYLAIGSIISRANSKSVVWGSGAFGTENEKSLSKHATYLAVRGPLTRNLLRIHGINCPAVYGDPALLIPRVFNPSVQKKYKVGVILRWAEKDWNNVSVSDDLKKIYLGTDDIEGTLLQILQCENIVSSSLHGIILADAYGIPSAWLSSETPKGLEFKFYDYFLSVNKVQSPQMIDFSIGHLSFTDISRQLVFNEKKIEFNEGELIRACPFVEHSS
jgi:pyruvyltransferase